MENKKLTGYPSIDKPQYAFYKKEPTRIVNTEQTIYNLVFSKDQDMKSVALEYLGAEWTYKKLKKETDKAANSFYSSGLRIGDTVLIGASNCPEVVVCLLALNKIGVVSKWFDIRAGERDIEEYANESNCKYMISFDMLISKVSKVIDNTSLERILVITPADSLSAIKRTGYAIKEMRSIPKDSRFIRFRDFIKNYNSQLDIECVPFDKNRPSIMVQSSGTTGKPKVIVHSDYSATSCVRSLSYSDLPISEKKILLNLLPPWIAYALGEAIIYPLSFGCKVILSPTFEPEVIMNYIGKFTVVFTAPPPYRYLYDHFDELSSKKQKEFFDTVDTLISGGDKISVEENKRLEQRFKVPLVNGYGDNEGWGCLTVNPTKNNKYGSVGIPKYGETIVAYDNEKGAELPYNESGEICALANTMFLYYEGNEKETSVVKRKHNDEKIWLHTGDLGYIDEDGYVFLKGRLRRVITRLGFKISAYTIEDKISELPFIKECVVVEVIDRIEEHVPMAFIVLNDNKQETDQNIKEQIINKCKRELKEYEIPKHIEIVQELPYTQNGKYDFRELEKIGNELVFEEEN